MQLAAVRLTHFAGLPVEQFSQETQTALRHAFICEKRQALCHVHNVSARACSLIFFSIIRDCVFQVKEAFIRFSAREWGKKICSISDVSSGLHQIWCRIRALFCAVVLPATAAVYPIKAFDSIRYEFVPQEPLKTSKRVYEAWFEDECESIISAYRDRESGKSDKERIYDQLEIDLKRNLTVNFYINKELITIYKEAAATSEKHPNASRFFHEIKERTGFDDESCLRSLSLLQQGSRAKTFEYSKSFLENQIENVYVVMVPIERRDSFPTDIHLECKKGSLQFSCSEYFLCQKIEDKATDVMVLRHTTAIAYDGEKGSYKSLIDIVSIADS